MKVGKWNKIKAGQYLLGGTWYGVAKDTGSDYHSEVTGEWVAEAPEWQVIRFATRDEFVAFAQGDHNVGETIEVVETMRHARRVAEHRVRTIGPVPGAQPSPTLNRIIEGGTR